jgi:hypothetical protein
MVPRAPPGRNQRTLRVQRARRIGATIGTLSRHRSRLETTSLSPSQPEPVRGRGYENRARDAIFEGPPTTCLSQTPLDTSSKLLMARISSIAVRVLLVADHRVPSRSSRNGVWTFSRLRLYKTWFDVLIFDWCTFGRRGAACAWRHISNSTINEPSTQKCRRRALA